jgi:hypothetical protein
MQESKILSECTSIAENECKRRKSYSNPSDIEIPSGSKVLKLCKNNDNRIAAIVILASDSTTLTEVAKMRITQTGSLLNVSAKTQSANLILGIE